MGVCWNWQTTETQNLRSRNGRVGSNPSMPTIAPWCNDSAFGFEPKGLSLILGGATND